MAHRCVVLDTETTGLEVSQGHKIIEIGCVEMINRRITDRHYHQYIQPNREIDAGAQEVHGITQEFLADKPDFSTIAEDFIAYIEGAELIIHNAPFDVGFIDYEFGLLDRGLPKVADICQVTDTVVMARKKHPGQKNNLDALCKRYGVDNSHRELHGALLDAEILADVYLAMTGGQTKLLLAGETNDSGQMEANTDIRRLDSDRPALAVVQANEEELAAHQAYLEKLKSSAGQCKWLELEEN